ncbi:MAG TPA: hypothetical protein VGR32_08515 [Brevundimonas sp.]|jgi:hypothetical protein|uniref:hypothetical protein n=1 Tax=Brevundimonas sp. TaxID=1871086 RepID=UPI002DE7EC76|nr:hypothetical protein [Brevundimonas sp.]
MRLIPPAAAAALTVLAAACSSAVEAPYDPGVCYYVVPDEAAENGLRFNVVARDQPQMEHCAARLEEMRLRFVGLGGSNREIMGSYQGKFIFIDATGVKVGDTLTGGRYFFLARAPGGQLAIPGAIQRDIDGRPIGVIAPPPEPAAN